MSHCKCMMIKMLGILFTTASISIVHAQTDTFIDNRDGQKYSTALIGNKIWFQEHLRYKTSLSYCSTFHIPGNEGITGNYYSGGAG